MYKLNRERFFKIKEYLDGYVFWKEEEEFIILEQVIPSKEIRKLLINNLISKI